MVGRDEPGYLALLGLSGRTSQVVLDRIEQARAQDGALIFVERLFESGNWRCHLVGAMALLFDDSDDLGAGILWRAIDAGSWVVPQLAVTALIIDRDFPARLVERVERSCPVSVPSPSKGCPGTELVEPAKLLASLLTIGSTLPSLSVWIADVRQRPTLVDLLKEDDDNAGAIAAGWHRNLIEQFAVRGRVLKPKAG
jgi:hypothetical protein